MEILNVDKFGRKIQDEAYEINGLIVMNENLMHNMDSSSEEYIQMTRALNKLRGRARGLRQALSIARELAVKL